MTTFRPADRKDINAVIALLAEDILGRGRETATLEQYLAAFDKMQSEGYNQLIVGEQDGNVVACYQITFISGLSLAASRRAQIEGVRVSAALRGNRIGEELVRDAESRARAAGCALMQFTTNKTRNGAHRFYDRMGFIPSHIGYKKAL